MEYTIIYGITGCIDIEAESESEALEKANKKTTEAILEESNSYIMTLKNDK